MIRTLLCLLALVPLATGQDSASDVAGLPRAKAERWVDWEPGPKPLESIAEPYLAAVRLYQEGRIPLAIEGALAVLQSEADYPPALLLGAACAFRLQRYGDTVELLERLLDHVPAELGRTRQLGHALHSLGRSSEALEHYERLLAVRPDDLTTLRARGVVLLRTGDVEGALRDLDQVLGQLPQDPEALYWRAAALFDDEREGAHEASRLARDFAPYTARVWYLLAQAAGEAGEETEAQEARNRHAELAAAEAAKRPLEQRLMRDPTDLAATEDLARLYLTIGDLARSRAAYTRLIRVAEHHGDEEVAARARRGLEGQSTLGR